MLAELRALVTESVNRSLFLLKTRPTRNDRNDKERFPSHLTLSVVTLQVGRVEFTVIMSDPLWRMKIRIDLSVYVKDQFGTPQEPSSG